MKRKRISKKKLYTILGVLIIFVSTLTVAYSVLSTTLNISGSSKISGSNWNIIVEKYDFRKNLSTEDLNFMISEGIKIYNNGFASGAAELIKEPTISGTTISDIQVSLIKPDDSIFLFYTVTNNGSIPARIDSIVQNTPSFSSATNNASDLAFISENLSSEFALLPDESFNWLNKLSEGYVLCPGETIYIDFVVNFDNEATKVSSSNITVSNLGGTVNFVQTNKNACVN